MSEANVGSYQATRGDPELDLARKVPFLRRHTWLSALCCSHFLLQVCISLSGLASASSSRSVYSTP